MQKSQEIFSSFFLSEGEFAVLVANIQEVVNWPGKLTKIPLAPDYVEGFFNLRGDVVPVVNLKTILRLEKNSAGGGEQKVAIFDCGGVKVGLLIDRTGEIFRVQPGDVGSFAYEPSTFPEKKVISGAIKLDQGKRLIQILDVSVIIKLDCVPQVERTETAFAAVRRKKGDRKQCISFLVGGSRCGFGIEDIQEIIKAPKLSASALSGGNCIGVLELRGDVLPVIDFSSLLGYGKPQDIASITPDQRILVMKLGGASGDEKFGILIGSVESIVTYYAEDLLALPTIQNGRAKLFCGCVSKAGLPDVILLNPTEILSETEVTEVTRGHSKLYQTANAHAQATLKRGGRKSYITFRVGDLFALAIDEVKEVIELPADLLQPPGLPEHVRGMMNLRGHIVAVFDVRSLYRKPKADLIQSSKIMIFENSGQSYGMMVDSVESIIAFSDEERIKLPENFLRGSTMSGSGQDIKFAVEVETGSSAKKETLFVLDLKILSTRVGVAGAGAAA